MSNRLIAAVSLFLALVHTTLACPDSSAEATMTMTLTSSAFGDNGAIPRDYTCDGRDLSPPLAWTGVPAETRSLALIVDDPDAPDPAHPRMAWVHWILYNIPSGLGSLAAGAAQQLPTGISQGLNDWQRADYGGPCPPIGRHRYFHKLYALDIRFDEGSPMTKAMLEKAMEGHILARATLVGTYQKEH